MMKSSTHRVKNTSLNIILSNVHSSDCLIEKEEQHCPTFCSSSTTSLTEPRLCDIWLQLPWLKPCTTAQPPTLGSRGALWEKVSVAS